MGGWVGGGMDGWTDTNMCIAGGGMGGWMDTNIYYGLPPAGGRIRSQGNKMRRLKPKGVIESSTLGVVQEGSIGL